MNKVISLLRELNIEILKTLNGGLIACLLQGNIIIKSDRTVVNQIWGTQTPHRSWEQVIVTLKKIIQNDIQED